MNILKLLADLAATNPASYEHTSPRRAALIELRRLGGKTLAAALPLGLAALPATARDTRTKLDVLLLALQLERLQNALYTRVLSTSTPASFFPTDPTFRASIATMQRHQQQHIAQYTTLITASGGLVPAMPNYDFTGARNGSQSALFPAVFSNFDEFLRLAQLVEDAGVRAYKGQVQFLISDNAILQTAIQVHATEARHAARIRTMRRQRGVAIKPWPSPTEPSITTTGRTEVVYAGEHLTTQVLPNFVTVPFQTLPIGYPGTDILTRGVPEAFDEPLTAEQALSFVEQFTY